MKMITLTKEPEGCPVDITHTAITAYHPWMSDGDMCVKVYLASGTEILVSECMRDIRELLSVTPKNQGDNMTFDEYQALSGEEKMVERLKSLHAVTSATAVIATNMATELEVAQAQIVAIDEIDWRQMFLAVHDRMRKAGESKEMGARWFAESARAALKEAK